MFKRDWTTSSKIIMMTPTSTYMQKYYIVDESIKAWMSSKCGPSAFAAFQMQNNIGFCPKLL